MIDYTQETVALDIPGIPDDTKYIGDRLDKMAAQLGEIAEAVIRRERPAPELFEVVQVGGQSIPARATSVRIRVTHIIVMCGSASGTVTLRVGVRGYPFDLSNNDRSVPLAFPIVLDAGVDIAATHSGAPGTAWGFYIFGYPEE